MGEQEIGLKISFFLQFVIVPVLVGRSLVSPGILEEVWTSIGMQASELWTGSRVVLVSGNTCLRRGFRIICEGAGPIPQQFGCGYGASQAMCQRAPAPCSKVQNATGQCRQFALLTGNWRAFPRLITQFVLLASNSH